MGVGGGEVLTEYMALMPSVPWPMTLQLSCQVPFWVSTMSTLCMAPGDI